MPVAGVRRDHCRVAGVQDLHRLAFELDASHAGNRVEDLPDRMAVPRRACARGEVHVGRAHPRRRLADDDRVLQHDAGEVLGRGLPCRPLARTVDFHRFAPSVSYLRPDEA